MREGGLQRAEKGRESVATERASILWQSRDRATQEVIFPLALEAKEREVIPGRGNNRCASISSSETLIQCDQNSGCLWANGRKLYWDRSKEQIVWNCIRKSHFL